jgi:hypothetical protein
MRRLRIVCLVAASLLVLAVAACSSDSGQEGSDEQTGAETNAEAGGVLGTTAANQKPPKELKAEDFDPSLFDDSSASIDNEWVPLEPGKRFTWRGSTEEEGERISHRIVFTVTDLTKVIGGVRTLIGWDRDFSEGQLVEAELIFLAQDKYGNVWHFGQYSEEWDGRELVGGQAWLVGYLEGARAGIWVKAEPQVGKPAYSQGFAPAPFFWDDFAKTAEVDAKTCVPVGCFEDVVVVEEFEPTKPGAYQLKYYARGVGNVRVGWRGKDADREVLVLQKVERLDSEALAEARAEALQLETRASMYGRTPPAEPRASKTTG